MVVGEVVMDTSMTSILAALCVLTISIIVLATYVLIVQKCKIRALDNRTKNLRKEVKRLRQQHEGVK